MKDPKANAVLVEALSRGVRSTGNGLADVPNLIKRVLAEEAWREFITPRGELVQHERFADFVTTPPTAGLGADIDLVRRIVENDPEALDLLDQALQNPIGHPPATIGNNVPDRPEGNTQAKALRRLRKDAPELHAEVLAGHLSAHGAMIKAGFRRKTVSVPVDRPEAVAKTLRKNLSPDDLAALVRLLGTPDT